MDIAITKPLVWEDCGEDMGHCADVLFGRYWAEKLEGVWHVRLVTVQHERELNIEITTSEDLDKAKAAAGADHETRILASMAHPDMKELLRQLLVAKEFINEASGAALALAMSGDNHPNPEGVLTDLSRRGMDLAFDIAEAIRPILMPSPKTVEPTS